MQVGIIGKGSLGKCLAHSLRQSTSHRPSLLVKPDSFNALKTNNLIQNNQCEVTYYPYGGKNIQKSEIPIYPWQNNGSQLSFLVKEGSLNVLPGSNLIQSNTCEVTYHPYLGETIQASQIPIYPLQNNGSQPLFDAIIISTKSFQLISALNQLETNNFLQNNPTVILFHNGIIPTCEIPSFIRSRNIPLIFGTTSHPATMLSDDGPLTVRHVGPGQTWLGYRDPFSNYDVDKDELCNMFDAAFKPCKWFNDLEPHLLYKLAINCCINPLTAIYQIRNDELVKNEKYQQEMKQLCTEICDVYRAYFENHICKKNEILDVESETVWNKLCNFDVLWDIVCKTLDNAKLNYSSMNRDVYFERKSEIEHINGYIVKLGKEYNVNVEFNDEIVCKINEIESRYCENML